MCIYNTGARLTKKYRFSLLISQIAEFSKKPVKTLNLKKFQCNKTFCITKSPMHKCWAITVFKFSYLNVDKCKILIYHAFCTFINFSLFSFQRDLDFSIEIDFRGELCELNDTFVYRMR